MTLVLSVHSRHSLWLVVDRRLSYGGHRPPRDTAVKVMHLETTDGVGLLAYAGLGATPRGTQPSDWMSAVLRGRDALPFEQALGVLSAVANKELPSHLARIPGGAHFIIVPAFVRGVGPRLYSIDNVFHRSARRLSYRYTSHQRTAGPRSAGARLALGGTGGIYLARNRRNWQRALLSLVNAHDRRKVSDHVIADQLARLNYEAHQKVRDGSVGPRCIVVWRRRPDTRPDAPGGGHQFYTGVERDTDSPAIPTIVNGLDMQAIGSALVSTFQAHIARHGLAQAAGLFGEDVINQLVAKLPSGPDETLR